MITRRLVIHGLVQGVGFRWSLAREAEKLGLAGWVRNRREGTVEALLQGTPDAVAQLIAWAHAGPPAAQVTRVALHEAEGEFSGFEQWPTV